METLFKDIRYGFRSLLKHPVCTAVAVLTLALGFGANSAMFSTVNSVLLNPLSYPGAERIVVVEGITPPKGITQSNLSIPDFADWQSQNQVFDQLAGFVSGGSLLTSGEETERVRAASVTSDFFPLFGTAAFAGRTLQADDSEKGRDPVVVIGFGLWQGRFGGSQNVIGSKVILAGQSTAIVGGMAAGFDYPAQSGLWVPFPIEAPSQRRGHPFVSVGAL